MKTKRLDGLTDLHMVVISWLKLHPGTVGGNVVYTSFHNVGQSSADVEQILKYIVLHL